MVKRRTYLAPQPGDILAFRLTQADEAELIPWLAEQRIPAGGWSDWIRRVLHEQMMRQSTPPGGLPTVAGPANEEVYPGAADERLLKPLEELARRLFVD